MATERKLRRGATFEPEPDAAHLNLGPDFADAQSLTMAEAQLVVEAIRDARSHDGLEEAPTTDVMRKALDYMANFNRYASDDATQAVERLLASYPLHKFERAQLGTLCPEDPEEARTLIPTLAEKLSDDDLQSLLDELSNLRTQRRA